jgi:hypothetical protein
VAAQLVVRLIGVSGAWSSISGKFFFLTMTFVMALETVKCHFF